MSRLNGWLRAWVRPFQGSAPGATLVEYMIVAGFVSLFAIAAFNRFGRTVHGGLKVEAKRIEGQGLPSAADFLGALGNGTPPACSIFNRAFCADGSGQCFGRGTLVATEAGDRPIEQIQVGDRVWARSPKTGLLELKPVLRTFITPAMPVIDLEIREGRALSEHITVTSGHRFWVDGEGWVAAEDLTAKQVWTPEHALAAEPLATGSETTTVYNLEVGEFHNYLVGHAHALVHNQNDDDCLGRSEQMARALVRCLQALQNNANAQSLCNAEQTRLAACGQNDRVCTQVEQAVTQCIASGRSASYCHNQIWQQIGEQAGADQAEHDGLEEIIPGQPWPEINPIRRRSDTQEPITGIDDIRVDANGNVYIVEYKTNDSPLGGGPPPQMSQAWVDQKISEIQRWLNNNSKLTDPTYDEVESVYEKLVEARRDGTLYGIVYRTTSDPNGPNGLNTDPEQGFHYNPFGGATTVNCAAGGPSPPCPRN